MFRYPPENRAARAESSHSFLPWQFLYFFPLPQGQRSFLPTFFSLRE
jgi:hypothetical protein